MVCAIRIDCIFLYLVTNGQLEFNMIKLFKNLFKKKEAIPKKKSDNVHYLTPKEIATSKGEPWVDIISLDLNPSNPEQGSFNLDWNDKFIANLVRAGYRIRPDDTDADIVDRWFTTVCKNVVLETYEQEQAMNPNRPIKTRDLGDGYSERY